MHELIECIVASSLIIRLIAVEQKRKIFHQNKKICEQIKNIYLKKTVRVTKNLTTDSKCVHQCCIALFIGTGRGIWTTTHEA